MRIILSILIISSSLYAKSNDANIPFMEEGRQQESQLIRGWYQLWQYVYYPSHKVVRQLVTRAASSRFGLNQDFRFHLDNTLWQYVIFKGSYLGLIAEIPIYWQNKQAVCYIYSRFYERENSWSLNNFKCEETYSENK
ncbi:MAG: hypothetical protein KDD58_13150 [Bdellovibrionales bacterium]|nr:hypothetical protein [Bdellovibrionales bacterium]